MILRKATLLVRSILGCMLVSYAHAEILDLPPAEGMEYVFSFEELTRHLSSDERERLTEGKQLSFTGQSQKKDRIRYLPVLSQTKEIRRNIVDSSPSVFYEMVYMLPAFDAASQRKILVTVANYFRDLSLFPKIRYKNIQDGNIHPLFLSSQEIQSVEDRSPVRRLRLLEQKDFMSGAHADETIIQQDTPPFGDVVSRYQFSYDDAGFSITGVNLTPVIYKRISAAQKGKLITYFAMFRSERGVLIYGIGGVRVSGFALLFKRKVLNSFESRSVGLFEWVYNRYMGLL